MSKKNIYFLILFSLSVHLYFISSFPLTADEINVFNIYFLHSPDFTSFWKYFIQYDTHQPLFHTLWYPFFNAKFNEVIFRLPSFALFAGSVVVWKKLFPYKDEENVIPWILFLFCPFVIVYTGLFLPYSLLLFSSVLNFYLFNNLEKEINGKTLFYFFASCILLTFTHYYGALQAFLLIIFLVFRYGNLQFKLAMGLSALFLIEALLSTDFINDFATIHSYRHAPTPINILGYLNLLIGGRYIALLLLILIIIKKNFSILKTKEFLFVITVIIIAFLKSVLISPSLEARYLLILIYPLYFHFKDLQRKYTTPAIIIICFVSLDILMKSYGPSFVVDYSRVEKTTETTGLMIAPCPKYYFQEENYICIDHALDTERMIRKMKRVLVHQDHIKIFKELVPEARCLDLKQGIFDCKLSAKF